MMNRKGVAVGGLLAAVVACGSAVAFAGAPEVPMIHPANHAGDTPQAVSPASPEITAAFPALGDGVHAADLESQQVMRNQLGSTSDADHGPIGTADFGKATSSAIADSRQRASLVASGDKACLVLPDPVDGYGASCYTLDQVKAGGAFVAMGAPAGAPDRRATIGVLVPRDGAVPAVVNGDGTVSRLRVDGNVAAAVVATDTGDSLVIGSRSVPLSTFDAQK